MTGQHPSEPRTAAGRDLLSQLDAISLTPYSGVSFPNAEYDILAIETEAEAQRDRRPEQGDYRYKPGSDLDVAHAFGFREGYELAEKRAVAQRDRLRAALGEIRALADSSVEDMRSKHGSERRVLMAVIPSIVDAALTDDRPDALDAAIHKALTDEPEGET